MLHHRTLNPVVIRDWSSKMELFTSALAQTASTSSASHKALNLKQPRLPKEYNEFAITAWFRPEPQPSTYLYTAFEPVPWPEREGGHRPATGGRPLLPSERRAFEGYEPNTPGRGRLVLFPLVMRHRLSLVSSLGDGASTVRTPTSDQQAPGMPGYGTRRA